MTIRLTIRGNPFTLFYDYDQLKTKNLSLLTDTEKLRWFEARHNHVFLEPQRSFWIDESMRVRLLKALLPTVAKVYSLKLVAFGGLLNATEAMGSFLIPGYTGKQKNRRRFEKFVHEYMPQWDTQVTVPSGETLSTLDLLWKRYRNAIAHGFHVEGGGIEYLAPGTRICTATGWVRVCPRQYLKDYADGVDQYLTDLRSGTQSLVQFLARFNSIYPS